MSSDVFAQISVFFSGAATAWLGHWLSQSNYRKQRTFEWKKSEAERLFLSRYQTYPQLLEHMFDDTHDKKSLGEFKKKLEHARLLADTELSSELQKLINRVDDAVQKSEHRRDDYLPPQERSRILELMKKELGVKENPPAPYPTTQLEDVVDGAMKAARKIGDKK